MKYKINVSEEEYWMIEEQKAKFRVQSLAEVFQKLGVGIDRTPKLNNVETAVYEYLKERSATANELKYFLNATSGRISQIMNGRGKNPGLLFKRKDIVAEREKKPTHKITYSLRKEEPKVVMEAPK